MATDAPVDEKTRKDISERIETQVAISFSNPQEDPNAAQVGYWLMGLLMIFAEDRYGDSLIEPKKIRWCPAFRDIPSSRVGVNVATNDYPEIQYWIFLAHQVDSWHQYFYEIAHEIVHLLCPVDTNVEKVAMLEEGVAVKFAENMYRDYVNPLSDFPVPISPLKSPASQYASAYLRASKIPDAVLKDVRLRCNGFHKVENPLFYSLVKDYVTTDDVYLLCEPFRYGQLY